MSEDRADRLRRYLKQNREEMLELAADINATAEYKRFHKLEFFSPIPKQHELIAMSREKNELCLFAGNRLGKTELGAYMTACHLTGLYPENWPGRRWDRPITAWACGESGGKVRDVPQTKLIGPAGDKAAEGTGFLPRDSIIQWTPAHGTPGLVDIVQVRHASGGVSRLQFKSYEQGRGKFQGDELDLVWFDEEPPGIEGMPIYNEGRMRRSGTRGLTFMTFTPLYGRTGIVDLFLKTPADHRGYVIYTIDDATFLPPEDRARMAAECPENEREARLYGNPLMGTGLVFQTPWTNLLWNRTGIIPMHWPKLWGVDFGINHPFAAVLLAWDRDGAGILPEDSDTGPYQKIRFVPPQHEWQPLPARDEIYILAAFKIKGEIPSSHAARMRRVADAVPVAWPHDGTHREASSGDALQVYYKREGLLMLPEHATHVGGGYSTEAGVAEMDMYMREGRFHVAADLTDWLDEYRAYHRKEDGAIDKVNDDIMSATRMAVMMRRFARTVPLGQGGIVTVRANRPTQAAPLDPFTNRPYAAHDPFRR